MFQTIKEYIHLYCPLKIIAFLIVFLFRILYKSHHPCHKLPYFAGVAKRKVTL